MYDVNSKLAEEFVNNEEIERIMAEGQKLAKDRAYVEAAIEKAGDFKGLTPTEACALSYVEEDELLEKMYKMANKIKNHIYGNRIVMFAPLYVSDYCVNGCQYCGYCNKADIKRSQLTKEQLIREVQIIEEMGHKRIALESGEDPVECPLDYILECLDTIYSITNKNGEIRRVNVNIAATTVEEYKRLKEAGIGTYILFQETYHKETYERVHPNGPKSDYEWHTTAHDRAMEAGIDDVGFGALYGLYDWHFDMVGTLLHALHMEARFGVGPHTISVPRIRPLEGVEVQEYEHAVCDKDFKKLVAIIRMAVPYTGMIISTRESQEMREELLKVGISQLSAGSCTSVGGYAAFKEHRDDVVPQFVISDDRSPIEITKDLMKEGYIPSFCTACYRAGRTGDRFMRLAKTGQICNICLPNAMLTLKEYSVDYGDQEFKDIANKLIADNMKNISNETVRAKAANYLSAIEEGRRDLRF